MVHLVLTAKKKKKRTQLFKLLLYRSYDTKGPEQLEPDFTANERLLARIPAHRRQTLRHDSTSIPRTHPVSWAGKFQFVINQKQNFPKIQIRLPNF